MKPKASFQGSKSPRNSTAAPMDRRAVLAAGAGVGAAAVASSSVVAPAIAQGLRRWTMVTSWAKGSAGPGGSADRIAAAITRMSGGRLEVLVRGAGELVSPFGVLDAVSEGIAELGHTASFFWAGRVPQSAFFTTVPFGLTATSHNAWVRYGGGQALWEAAYSELGLLPRQAGNSGMTMAGWSRRPLNSIEDLAGLKMRIAGVGAQVYGQLGVIPVSLPPSEIFLALSTGQIDAVEFLGPFSDANSGFQRAAGHYYFPGFNKPNGTAEGLVNASAYQDLPEDLAAIVDAAFDAENDRGLAEAAWFNAEALARLRQEPDLKIAPMPADIVAAAERLTAEVLADQASSDPGVAAVLESYQKAVALLGDWDKISAGAYQARGTQG